MGVVKRENMASHIFSLTVHNYLGIGKLTLFLELSKCFLPYFKGTFCEVLQVFRYFWIFARVKVKCLMVRPSWGCYWPWLCILLNGHGYAYCLMVRWMIFLVRASSPMQTQIIVLLWPCFFFCISVTYLDWTLTSNRNFSMTNWFCFSTLPCLFWWQWWSYCCICGNFWRDFKRTFTE